MSHGGRALAAESQKLVDGPACALGDSAWYLRSLCKGGNISEIVVE
jgi:hypothetical protein